MLAEKNIISISPELGTLDSESFSFNLESNVLLDVLE
jgi:hypothetical protein